MCKKMYIVFATIKTVEVKYMVFAVDFDGTLSFGKWPECGPANEGLIDFLNKRRQLGDKIILWTCREGANLDLAVEWCQNKGLNFDAVNDNLPDVIEKYGGNSRKVSCDFYIDDRAVSSCVYKLLEA